MTCPICDARTMEHKVHSPHDRMVSVCLACPWMGEQSPEGSA